LKRGLTLFIHLLLRVGLFRQLPAAFLAVTARQAQALVSIRVVCSRSAASYHLMNSARCLARRSECLVLFSAARDPRAPYDLHVKYAMTGPVMPQRVQKARFSPLRSRSIICARPPPCRREVCSRMLQIMRGKSSNCRLRAVRGARYHPLRCWPDSHKRRQASSRLNQQHRPL